LPLMSVTPQSPEVLLSLLGNSKVAVTTGSLYTLPLKKSGVCNHLAWSPHEPRPPIGRGGRRGPEWRQIAVQARQPRKWASSSSPGGEGRDRSRQPSGHGPSGWIPRLVHHRRLGPDLPGSGFPDVLRDQKEVRPVRPRG